MHFSAIISLVTQEEVQKTLRTQIVVAETTVHAVKYTDNKSHNQCLKCQEFKHTHQKCINATHVKSAQKSITQEITHTISVRKNKKYVNIQC